MRSSVPASRVGPAPDSIERMGSKVEAKKLMEAAGVPVLANLSPESATEADLPLLVKASAGGGGRGMRIVRALADLPAEIEKAAAEAESAFGDGTVFVEPYVEHGRHVEVQVVGHAAGVLVLGERDCSSAAPPEGRRGDPARASPGDPKGTARRGACCRGRDRLRRRGHGGVPRRRRHQPLLVPGDEHPAPGRAPGHRARARGRPGGGAARVAESGQLPLGAVGQTYGHAIEVRLYAEDPAADWQPQSGTLSLVEVPGVAAEFDLLNRSGIRLDSGFETGSEVSTHYDAMLAKVISWAPTRALGARQLAGAVAGARIHGVTTNRDLLVQVLRDEEFLAGQVSTAFLERSGAPTGDDSHVRSAAVAAALAMAERAREARTVQRGIPVACATWCRSRRSRTSKAAWRWRVRRSRRLRGRRLHRGHGERPRGPGAEASGRRTPSRGRGPG